MKIEPLEPNDCDGDVYVRESRREPRTIVVTVMHEGEEQTIAMSEFNARRAFGLLSRTVGKAIKL